MPRGKTWAGATPGESARIARAVLGGEDGPARDVVLLNAGVRSRSRASPPTSTAGIALAASSIDGGTAASTLERWVEVSVAVAQEGR